MLKIRIIPVLTFNGIGLVKTKQFGQPRMVGNPIQAARVYNSRGVDELIFTDIFATPQKRSLNLSFLEKVLKECFIPLGVGGGIRNLADVRAILLAGADKVVLKAAALERPALVTEIADAFGSQAVTVSVDGKRDGEGGYRIWDGNALGMPVKEFVELMTESGAGELFVNSVDRDGMMDGFEVDLIHSVAGWTHLPLIACGGAGKPSDFAELHRAVPVGGLAAASIFHFTQYTPHDIKLALQADGKPVRVLRQLQHS